MPHNITSVRDIVLEGVIHGDDLDQLDSEIIFQGFYTIFCTRRKVVTAVI